MQKTIFITGTDTSAGKTVLTALLLSHLRQTGSLAFALKPFCSGGRADPELLHILQEGQLTLDAINPFFFSEPLTPLVAARNEKRRVPFDLALRHIQCTRASLSKIKNQKSKIQTPTLLIEGAGGLLAPLGESGKVPLSKIQNSKFMAQSSGYYTALDLINALKCRVLLVAPNRLGTINHTLLTIQALQTRNIHKIRVVLMDLECPSLSRITHHASCPASRTNPSILAELLCPIPLFHIPYLTKNPSKPEQICKFAKKCKKTLAEILG